MSRQGLEPFPTQSSLSELLMFQISVSGETMHISLSAFSALSLPFTLFFFYSPSQPQIFVFVSAFLASLSSESHPNHFLFLFILLTSSPLPA